MTPVELRVGDASVLVDAGGGGRVRRLDVDGLAFVVPPEVDERNHGVFPMAPWAGRVRNGEFVFDGETFRIPVTQPPHAIHGTVRDVPWTIEHVDATSLELLTELDDRWPFGGHVVQRMVLEPGSLSLTLEVHADDRRMPATCGWHPWWSRDLGRGEELEVELHADVMYRRDGDGIPTGELVPIAPPPWDDCFTDLGAPAAVLRWPGAATLTIESDCACVVVYTEPERAVCVEPQSGPPDAFNLDVPVVEPEAPLVVHTTWRWALDG